MSHSELPPKDKPPLRGLSYGHLKLVDSHRNTSFWNRKSVQLSGVDIRHFDVDAFPPAHVLPAMFFRQELDRDEPFCTVYSCVVTERLDPKLVVVLKQSFFHRSALPSELSISRAIGIPCINYLKLYENINYKGAAKFARCKRWLPDSEGKKPYHPREV